MMSLRLRVRTIMADLKLLQLMDELVMKLRYTDCCYDDQTGEEVDKVRLTMIDEGK